MAINTTRRLIQKVAGKTQRVTHTIRRAGAIGTGHPNKNLHRNVGKKLGDIKADKGTMLIKRTNQGRRTLNRGDDIASRLKKISASKKATNQTISKWTKETDDIAQKFGFKNEKDFAQYIRRTTDTSDVGLKRIKSRLWQYARKHKYPIAKAALATGTIAGMLSYLKAFQENNAGCFRYMRDDQNGLIRFKFKGNFCNSDTDSDMTSTSTAIESVSKDIKILPEKDHPLFGHSKWDCGYDHFLTRDPSEQEKVYNIINLGCNGLCDWENFNHLSLLTSDTYQPVLFNPEQATDNSCYIYRCENTTILRGLSETFGNVISDTVTGLGDSRLVTSVYGLFSAGVLNLYKLLVVIIVFLFIYKYSVHYFQKKSEFVPVPIPAPTIKL